VLVQLMMAKDRNFRQKSWDELIRDIDLVLDDKMPATPFIPVSGPTPTEKFIKSYVQEEIKLPEPGAWPAKTPISGTAGQLHCKSKMPWIIGAVIAALAIIITIIVFLFF